MIVPLLLSLLLQPFDMLTAAPSFVAAASTMRDANQSAQSY